MFDGDCGVCTWAARMARRIDRKKKAFHIRPYQHYTEDELEPYALTRKQLGERLHLVTPTGKVRTGAFAVNAFLVAHFPWSVAVVLVCLAFPLLLLEMAAYSMISRHRHRVSQWLGLAECAVGQNKPKAPSRSGREPPGAAEEPVACTGPAEGLKV